MGGLVVGSAFPSYVGESEVGAAIVPTAGAFVRDWVDYTRLDPASSLNLGLVFWLPLQDRGLEQRQLATWPTSNGGALGLLKWAMENTLGFGPRGYETCSATSDLFNTLDLGFDIFSDRPVAGTLAMWFRAPGPDTADLLVFRMGDLSDGVLFGVAADGRAQVLFAIGSAIAAFTVSTSTVLADGKWHHIAWSGEGFNAGSPWRIWIDGREETTIVLVGPDLGFWFSDVAVDNSNAALIDQLSLATNWSVEVADVGSWRRTLSADEITTLARDPNAIYARTRRATLLDRFRLHPVAITSAEAVGTPRVNQQIRPTAIASAETFGTAALHQQIRPVGIGSAEAFGTARVNQQVRPVAITSAEALGTPTLAQQVRPVAIASAEAFGTASLLQAILTSGIATAEAFGTAALHQQIRAAAIASAEAFGTPALLPEQFIDPSGITSAEAFGTPALLPVQFIVPAGIGSAEAFGLALVLFASGIDAAISEFTGERLSVFEFTGEQERNVDLQGARDLLHLFAGERRARIVHTGDRRSVLAYTGEKT